MKALLNKDLAGTMERALWSSSTCYLHLWFSPLSWPRRFWAAYRVSSAFLRLASRIIAAWVFLAKSWLSFSVAASSSASCYSHSWTLAWNFPSLSIKPLSSLVKGSIFNKTSEYLTFALTQAASGAVALEILLMLAYSKLIGLDWIILLT